MEEIRSPSTGGSVEEGPGDGGAMEAAAAVGDGAAKRARPEEAAGDGSAKRTKPEDEDAGDGPAKLAKPEDIEEEDDDLAWLQSWKHPKGLGFGETSTVPDTSYEEQLRAELNLMLQYQRLMAGGKHKVVKERVEQAGIEKCLRMGLLQPHPAGRTAVRQELPECLQHMPESFRAAFLKNKAKVKKAMDHQQDIVDQYYEKGYAEVDANVVE